MNTTAANTVTFASINTNSNDDQDLINNSWIPSQPIQPTAQHSTIISPAARSVSSQRSASLCSNITDGFESPGQPAPSMTEADSPHMEPDAIEPRSPTSSSSVPASKTEMAMAQRNQSCHVVRLSSIEHCMPRAYIRVCLAYRLPPDVDFDLVIAKLNSFTFKALDAKPYLAGYVVPATDPQGRSNVAEIQFTDQDFLNYSGVDVRYLTDDEMPYTYDELDAQGLPPSLIRPELVSTLPEGADSDRAAVFRMQANVVKGGLIVSVYLHHCISDGAGLGFLVAGKPLDDDFHFDRQLDSPDVVSRDRLREQLARWCKENGDVRSNLSRFPQNQASDRQIEYKRMSELSKAPQVARPRGQGTVFTFSKSRLDEMKEAVEKEVQPGFVSPHDTLLALLWHHMTMARKASVDSSIHSSKLFIPVNIRNKLAVPLSDSYFGAAVDFACAERSLSQFAGYETADRPQTLAELAIAIRKAIAEVNDAYIRQLIAVANLPDPEIDMRDVMATNMNRASGADMYITSWEKLGLYDATFGMGLGKPDWVRKPWSRDPGSCVVLPRDDRKEDMEVLVQMTEDDMARLLMDGIFMSFVTRVIDGDRKVP
ncbi:hypothetical protein DV735_g389, partial [Chaetothyriales sp. CBS 134920]